MHSIHQTPKPPILQTTKHPLFSLFVHDNTYFYCLQSSKQWQLMHLYMIELIKYGCMEDPLHQIGNILGGMEVSKIMQNPDVWLHGIWPNWPCLAASKWIFLIWDAQILAIFADFDVLNPSIFPFCYEKYNNYFLSVLLCDLHIIYWFLQLFYKFIYFAIYLHSKYKYRQSRVVWK